jgi:HEAT repeat protein
MIASLWEGPAGVVERPRIQDALLAAAADPDIAIRLAAVRGLGTISPALGDDPPPALPAALADPSDQVRTAAANALARFPKGLSRWLPSLVRSFEKAQPEARPAYALVLDRIRPRAFGADAVLALRSVLASPDDEVRRRAALSLRTFGAAAYPAIPALASSIGRPGRGMKPTSGPAADTDIRLTPDDELWWTAGPGSTDGNDPALAAALSLLRVLPSFAFVSRAPPIEEAKVLDDAFPSFPLVSRAPPIDPETFAALAEALRSGTSQVRAAVAYALGRFQPSPTLIPALGEAVRDPDATVRTAALKALHDLGDRMPFAPPETFAAALEDERPAVRYWAAAALGHVGLGVDAYIPGLLRHAETDADRDVRNVCAVEVCDFIKPTAVTPAVVPVLTKALESPDQDVRCAACGLLARLGPSSAPAIPRLIRLLEEPGGDPAEPARPTTLTDPQSWAATALGRIAPDTPLAAQAATALIEVLQTEPPTPATKHAIRALAGFGPPAQDAIPRLRELSKSTNRNLSEAAQRALSKLTARE